MKLLWAKLALVDEIFSPLRGLVHSEMKDDTGLLTKYGLSCCAASVA